MHMNFGSNLKRALQKKLELSFVRALQLYHNVILYVIIILFQYILYILLLLLFNR